MENDAIVILETKGPEFRAAYVNCADEIFGQLGEDDKWTPNSEYIHANFDSVTVHPSLDKVNVLSIIKGNRCYMIQHIDTWRETVYNNL